MIQSLFSRHSWIQAIAIFSMFFGAGNAVFPLLVGLDTGSAFPIALGGLLITSIGFPLIGLLGSLLFRGESIPFFMRAGKGLGTTMLVTNILLLGPLAVMPRCTAVAYGAFSKMLPGLSLPLFTGLFCILALILALKKNALLKILGYVLSPALLLSLVMVILRGGWNAPVPEPTTLSDTAAFSLGFTTGYDTLDLIAALFFSTTIWSMIRRESPGSSHSQLKGALAASLLAGLVLGAIYIGLCATTAFHAADLHHIPKDQLLSALAYKHLGPTYGTFAGMAIVLACLTTVVSIAVTLSNTLEQTGRFKRLPHTGRIIAMMAITMFCANWGFDSLVHIIHTMAMLLYPALITLTVCNIAHKLWGFAWVRTPVAATLAITLMAKVLSF